MVLGCWDATPEEPKGLRLDQKKPSCGFQEWPLMGPLRIARGRQWLAQQGKNRMTPGLLTSLGGHGTWGWALGDGILGRREGGFTRLWLANWGCGPTWSFSLDRLVV